MSILVFCESVSSAFSDTFNGIFPCSLHCDFLLLINKIKGFIIQLVDKLNRKFIDFYIWNNRFIQFIIDYSVYCDCKPAIFQLFIGCCYMNIQWTI